MTTRADLYRVMRNPPPNWGLLFAWVPGRSSKVRCLLCGRSGFGMCGRGADYVDFRGHRSVPAPWQAKCLIGHPMRCGECRRPFVSGTALSGHQTCKLHHQCCRDHTTVPAWKNPWAVRTEAS